MHKNSNQDLTFKIATSEDLQALVGLINSAYRGDSSRQGWTTEADFLEGQRTDTSMLQKKISGPDQMIWLAKNQTEILGCVYLSRAGQRSHLGMLTVNPQLQNSGLGKKLLEKVESFALNEWNCTIMELEVISIRHELIEFYKRRGYHITGEIRPFPMNDPQFGLPKIQLEFQVMEKKL